MFLFMRLLDTRHLPHFFKLISFALLSCAVFLSVSAQTKPKPTEYGRTLETTIRLTPEAVEKFANFQAPKENLNPANKIEALVADTEDWVGSAIQLDSNKGPYTLVVSLVGKAKADGHVSTLWNAGWDFSEGNGLMKSLPGLSKLDAKAGERVEITKAAEPMRFKESRTAKPALSLVHARNFEFESITVQIWSGVGENSWLDSVLAFRLLAVALIFFALRWWWVRR